MAGHSKYNIGSQVWVISGFITNLIELWIKQHYFQYIYFMFKLTQSVQGHQIGTVPLSQHR